MNFEKIISLFSEEKIVEVLVNRDECLYKILDVDCIENNKNIIEFLVMIAKDSNCPKEILRILSKDREYDVRCSVAKNTNCPEDVFEVLAKDSVTLVRCYVAQNLSCPEDICRVLANDGCAFVRKRVAENRNCPKESLFELLKDHDDDVRRRAMYKLGYINKFI